MGMGIKFYCPNGHKLNVKSFLAGKKAICPKCNVKVIVPLESQPLGAPTADPGEDGSAPADAWAQSAAIAPGAAQGPAEGQAGFQPRAGSVASNVVANAAGAMHFAAGMTPGMSPGAGVGQTMTDPIDEAPNAVWYVRPPSGGQFGPAAGPTMRSWIQEGRVSGNALVWRDGWPEWRSAATVFPSLGATPAGYAAPVNPVAVNPAAMGGQPGAWQGAVAPLAGYDMTQAGGYAGAQPVAHVAPLAQVAPIAQVAASMGQAPAGHVLSALETPLGGYDEVGSDDEMLTRRKRRKKEPDVTLYVTAALVIMTIVLVVVLVIVLVNQSKDPEAPAEPAKPAQATEETAGDNEEADTKPKPEKKKGKGKASKEASRDNAKDDTMQSP